MVYMLKHAVLQDVVPSGHSWLVPLRPYSLSHWPVIDFWPRLIPKHPPFFTSGSQNTIGSVRYGFNCFCRKALVVCNWKKEEINPKPGFPYAPIGHFDTVDISDHSSCGNEVQLSVVLLSHNYMDGFKTDLRALYSMPPWPYKMLSAETNISTLQTCVMLELKCCIFVMPTVNYIVKIIICFSLFGNDIQLWLINLPIFGHLKADFASNKADFDIW